LGNIQELVDSGRRLHQEGKLREAEPIYRQVLAAQPDHADTWQLLGMLSHATGKHEAAIEAISRALALEPENSAFHHNLGFVHHAVGQHAAAVVQFREAVRIAPAMFETHLFLSRSLIASGQLDEAAEAIRQAVPYCPDRASSWVEAARVLNDIGLGCWRSGRVDDAIRFFEDAGLLAPASGAAFNYLGSVFRQLGRLEEAIAAHRQAVEREPVNADYEMGLGRALQQQGKLAEALACYRNAATLDLLLSEAVSAQASLEWTMGNNEQAITSARESIALDPDNVPARHTLANLLHDFGKYDEAETEYHEVLRRNESFAPAHANLAYLLADQGKISAARGHYQAAIKLQPSERLRVVAGATVSPICLSVDEIHQSRSALSDELTRLYEEGVRVDTRRDTMPTLFYLAYHGLDDRPLMEQLARLSSAEPVPLRSKRRDQRRPEGRIRVGFLSMNLKQHTIGGLWASLIEGLSRTTFDVRILSVGHFEDAVARRIRARADQYVVLPRDVATALKTAAAQELDALIFPDIGMDSFTYTLGFSRLAPVQCVMWGHPNTTALPAIDYFLSSEHLETPDSDAHYTEQLVRFPRVMVCYERPERAANPVDRDKFGLSQSAHLYGCPQTLFKFHPEFDDVLREILAADPAGELVLIEGRYAHWREMLWRRLEKNLGPLCRRIRFMPRLSRPEYLNLLAATDVLLDPIHFGGGNTSYEGLSLGVPIVTLPSQFLRGRITYALYRQMDFDELIAERTRDYVQLALELGTNSDRRELARQRILEKGDLIFNDRQIMRNFEEFLIAAVNTPSM
jgi:protein O-GlcNAc transferase